MKNVNLLNYCTLYQPNDQTKEIETPDEEVNTHYQKKTTKVSKTVKSTPEVHIILRNNMI